MDTLKAILQIISSQLPKDDSAPLMEKTNDTNSVTTLIEIDNIIYLVLDTLFFGVVIFRGCKLRQK